jgi:hypothetical protein
MLHGLHALPPWCGVSGRDDLGLVGGRALAGD